MAMTELDKRETTPAENTPEELMPPRRPYTFDRVVRIIFSVCGALAVIYLLDVLAGVLLPFLVACLISYMLEPLVKLNMRVTRLQSRFIPVMLTLFETCTVAALLISVAVPYIVDECASMTEIVRRYATANVKIPYISDQIHYWIREYVDFDKLLKLMTKEEWLAFIKKSLSTSWNFLTQGVAFIAGVVSWMVVILYVIFIMLDYERLMLSFRQLVPRRHRRRVFRIGNDIKTSMNRYFRGQGLIAFLVGVMFAVGFAIIGLPMGVVLGLVIGVLNLVPYLQLVSLPVTALLCLVWTAGTGGDFWRIFWEAMAVYVVVQCIQDLLLTPKIMGKAMGLNPALILLSLSVWGSLLGFMGLIVALPLTTLLLSYYNLYIVDRS